MPELESNCSFKTDLDWNEEPEEKKESETLQIIKEDSSAEVDSTAGQYHADEE